MSTVRKQGFIRYDGLGCYWFCQRITKPITHVAYLHPILNDEDCEDGLPVIATVNLDTNHCTIISSRR